MNGSLRVTALSAEAQERMMHGISNAVLDQGGWVLSRSLSPDGGMQLSFEFQRWLCVDMYTLLVAAGLELSASSHWNLTELCRCTQYLTPDSASEIVTIDLFVRIDSASLGALAMVMQRECVA